MSKCLRGHRLFRSLDPDRFNLCSGGLITCRSLFEEISGFHIADGSVPRLDEILKSICMNVLSVGNPGSLVSLHSSVKVDHAEELRAARVPSF